MTQMQREARPMPPLCSCRAVAAVAREVAAKNAKANAIRFTTETQRKKRKYKFKMNRQIAKKIQRQYIDGSRKGEAMGHQNVTLWRRVC